MIPRIGRYQHSTIDPLQDDEPGVEGWSIVVSWLGIVMEFGFGRHSK